MQDQVLQNKAGPQQDKWPFRKYNTRAMDIARNAKKILQDYVEEIRPKLVDCWDKEIASSFGFNDRQKQMVRELLEHSKEHNLRASKRLRGSFVNYGYMLSGKEITDTVWQAAMGVELVHTALLMHDDFMDRDIVRRGGPTTHKFYESKFNNNEHLGASMAVTAADAVLCLGFELIHNCGNAKATKQMLRGITNTAYGQAYDLELETFSNWTKDDVLTLHKAKTAIYTYQNPLFVGAYLGEIGNPKVFEILKDYSLDGGLAFQLQDDILGVYGTPEKTGKSADSDLLQGKCTLLVLKLLENGTEDQKTTLRKVWGKIQAEPIDLDATKKAIMDSGSYDYSKNEAKKYALRAADTAAKLRKIPELNREAIDYIQGIAEYMVIREV